MKPPTPEKVVDPLSRRENDSLSSHDEHYRSNDSRSTTPSYEMPLWVFVIVAARYFNLYYTVTSLSFFMARLCWILWPFSRWRFLLWPFFGLLLIWCLLLTPAHVIFTPMDFWTERPPFETVRTVYDAGENTIIDVFAIHGLGSNPDSAWTYRNNLTEIHWLKDILPKEEGFQNIRVVMVNHQTHWEADAADASFEDHAEMILKDIESAYEGNQYRPIIFIAHSFGGLLLKQALILAKTRSSPIAKMTRGILFLGVPHRGSKPSYIGSLISCMTYWRGSSSTLLEYMVPDSDNIKSLERRFYDIYSHPHLQSRHCLPYICDFQEMRQEKLWRFALGPTVDRESSRASHGGFAMLDTDHRGLNKFRSTQDPNFRRFVKEFGMAFEHATIEKTSEQHCGTTNSNFKEYNVPFQLDLLRNDKFTGRLDVLQRIHESLSLNKKHGFPNFVILQGIGGIGKTEIAVEYSYLNQDRYSSVFWFDCTTENSVRRSFLRMANRVLKHYHKNAKESTNPHVAAADRLELKGLSDEKGFNLASYESAAEAVEAMGRWLAEDLNREWLLIFDNLDDPEAFNIMDYIPRTTWGSILITSRRRGLMSHGTSIEISEMKPKEGVQLLAKTSGLRRDHSGDEEQLVSKLLQLLEYYPLGIEQAGAYISLRISDEPQSYYHGLEDYLDSHQRNAKMVLQHKRFPVAWSNRNDTVLTTWEVSFDAIQEDSGASYLLLLCGFLAGSDNFEEMFSLDRRLSANDTTFKESASKLSSYSLVMFRGAFDAFSIHPLVQVWARERLSLDVQQQLAGNAVQLLYRAIRHKREQEPNDYLSFEKRIIPHLDSAVENMQRLLSFPTIQVSITPPSNSIRQGQLSNFYDIAQGWYLWSYGIISDIHIFYRRYSRAEYDPIGTGQLAYQLGIVYEDQGLFHNAERLYLWAFNEARKCLHIEHPQTLEIAGNLACTMHRQGRYDEALDWYNWLLASRGKVLGKEHYSTLSAMKALAQISEIRGDYDLALQLYFAALAGRQRVMRDTADALAKQGKYDEAFDWYHQAFDRGQKTLDESEKVIFMHEIAFTLKHQGKYDEELRWYKQALAEQQEALGEKHEDTLRTMQNIALALFNQGKYDEASSWNQGTFIARQETLGATHRETLYTMYNIALLFETQGKYDEALNWYQQTLAGQQETLGEDDEDTQDTVRRITHIKRKLDK